MKSSAQPKLSKPSQPSIQGSRLLYIIHSQGMDVKRLAQDRNNSITLRKTTILTQNLLLFDQI